MHDSGRRRTRTWVLAGLAVYLLAVVAILVLPVSYADIVREIGERLQAVGIGGFGTGWIEFVTNILLFAPFGFLLTLLFRHSWIGVVLALLFSAAAEVAQIVIPSRQPSLRDVLANVIGAAVGAAIAWLIVLHQRRRDVRASAAHTRDERQDADPAA